MRKMLNIIAVILCFPNITLAAELVLVSDFKLWATFAGDGTSMRITEVNVRNPDNCSDPDSYRILSTLSEEAKQRIYSTLLVSVTTKTPVELYVQGCESNRPTVTSVLIK